MQETKDNEKLKALLEPFGVLKPQLASDWSGETVLPDAVAEFYKNIGPFGPVIHQEVGNIGLTMSLGGNPIVIPPLHKLANYQVGYRTDGNTKQRIKTWPDNWLVIAYEGGNPFIFDSETNLVSFAYAGAGSWDFRKIVGDIYTTFGGIATIASVLHGLDEEEMYDDDFNFLDLVREKVMQDLSGFLGNTKQAKAFIETIGW